MSAAPAEGFEVEDLTPAALLDVARANETEIRRRELVRLGLAYQWAVLHPATEESGVQTPDGAVFSLLEQPDSLGGDGTPAVAAFTHESFALSLGMSPAAGAALVGDALDLRHRLPLLWGRVERLQVPSWQARRVATQTRPLPLAGARWVDEQLNLRTDGSCGPVITHRLVAQAAADFDPQTHEDREDQAEQASFGVELTHPDPVDYVGTSHLTATGDTPTLRDFHQLVGTLAHQLHQAGDTRPLGVRKLTAIRIITQLAAGALTGEQSLDLAGLDAETLDRLAHAVARHGGKIKLIVHVDQADLEVTADGETTLATGRVERLGAATIARLRAWVAHQAVQILPVLNMDRRDAVDGHDPPSGCASWSSSGTSTASSLAAPSMPDIATSTTPSRTRRSTKAAHLDKPTPATSPPYADVTTAPRPAVAGATSSRPMATSGTARTALASSPPREAPSGCPDARRDRYPRATR